MKRKGAKSEVLQEAIDKEIKYLKGDGLAKDRIEELRQIHDDEVDLEFVLEMEDEEDKAEEIEKKIEREVFKTKEQKVGDFRTKNPNLTMKYGGVNDVYQAAM